MFKQFILISVAKDVCRSPCVAMGGDIIGCESMPEAVMRVRHISHGEQVTLEAQVLSGRQLPTGVRRHAQPVPKVIRQAIDVMPFLGFEFFLWQSNASVGIVDVLFGYPATAGKSQADEGFERQTPDGRQVGGFPFVVSVSERGVKELRRLRHGEELNIAHPFMSALNAFTRILFDELLYFDPVSVEGPNVLQVIVEGEIGPNFIEVTDPSLDVVRLHAIEHEMTKLHIEQIQFVLLLPIVISGHLFGVPQVFSDLKIFLHGSFNGHLAVRMAGGGQVRFPASHDGLPVHTISCGSERTPAIHVAAAEARNHHPALTQGGQFSEFAVPTFSGREEQRLDLRFQHPLDIVEQFLAPLHTIRIGPARSFEFANSTASTFQGCVHWFSFGSYFHVKSECSELSADASLTYETASFTSPASVGWWTLLGSNQ
jgi:hypothetical protein